MRIDIITVLPSLLESPLSHSIIKRAREQSLVNIQIHDLRPYGKGKYRQTDDYPFGGGAGMVMMIEPIYRLIEKLKKERSYDEIIYTTPDGLPFTQKEANRLSCLRNIILLCGHYKGIDQRIRDHLITRELSIGDYVLSGGELAAAVVTDAVVRLLPGVLSDETSALTDTFQDNLLAPPIYTRPADFRGWKVPEVLLSGDPAKITEWEEKESLSRTERLRPDLLDPTMGSR
ncbi:MAG: tRNA (guanosine(37)-N1)-methyltransferase TrmD [Bacteroidales bacterium]|nr:tRNA (guanosine(37)-N1)-methyltransferase TrmD [Bacteroidales bacterium]